MAEAEAASTWRHVRYLLQISFKESETEQIFTIVISNQFKTGFRMRLTSSVKELEAILQKLINLDKIQNENETNDGSLAMRMNFLTKLFSNSTNVAVNHVASRVSI